MKTLLLVRHAKTQADSETGKDFDRMLTERGHKDAVTMAQRLLDRKIQIDVLVTSTAKRAMETAAHFYKAYKNDDVKLLEQAELYHAVPAAYYKVIENLSNDYKRAAIFAHNPGITDMANNLGVAHVDDMPTCAVFAITANTTDWKDFAKAEKRFVFFDSPKTPEFQINNNEPI
jgi:phosphohistidine phosphatase